MQDKYFDLLKNKIGNDAEIVKQLRGGMMNEAYIVRSSLGYFVYYISTKQANEMVNRPLERETQKIAYDLALTSENIYFDIENGIKINRFIAGKSTNLFPNFSYKKIAKLMFDLHSSKQPASVDYKPFDRLENYKKEASLYHKSFEKDFSKLYSFLMQNKEYLLKQKLALCHNDAQRSNIVREITNNYYFIDFEFAANNDPIYDIATFGNDDVFEGQKLLEEYEKLATVKDGLKRFALWRIDISLQWYLVALIKHYRGEGKTHNINFIAVAYHFLENAKQAYKLLEK